MATFKHYTVVVLNDTCLVDGGATLVALEDAQMLAQLGHRVIFFSACGTPDVDKFNGNIEWISLGQKNILEDSNRFRAAINGLWNFKAAYALGRLLEGLQSDSTVVHLHSWSKALSGSVVRIASRKGFRLICTLHDYFVLCPNGGLYDYPTRRICTLRPMSLQCMARNCDSRNYAHKIWRILRQFIWRYGARMPACFNSLITVSSFAANKLQSMLGGGRLVVINNQPTLTQEPEIPFNERKGILYIGRIAAEKGVDLYLDACEIADIPAIVIGDGPLLPEIRARWPNAQYTGWLEKAQITQYLRHANALVVPSLWYENSPMIIAEAMAAGVPVIVSDVGAAADLIKDRVTGLHFKNSDVTDLASKMRLIVDDHDFATSLGQAAYRYFWKDYKFRREKRRDDLLNCYENA